MQSTYVFLLLGLTLFGCANAAGYVCPSYVRAVHTYNPGPGVMPNVDVYLNNQLQQRWTNVPFRGVGAYIAIPPGQVSLGVKAAGSTGAYLATKSFVAAPGKVYTVGFTGPLAGPVGQVVSNIPPIVNEDAVQVPNPNRWRGLWYRWSETNLNIDFRVVAGNPAPSDISGAINVSVAVDVARLNDMTPKTVIPMPETVPGTYSFYPTVVGKNDPLFNGQRNEYVRIANLTTMAGGLYDFFATGDTLGAAHTNNLALVYTHNTVTFDSISGCTLITGAGGQVEPMINSVAALRASAMVVLAAIMSSIVLKVL